MLYPLKSGGEGLNLGHSPALGVLGMPMDGMIQHLHLQLVSWHTCYDLRLNSPFSQRSDFSRFHTRSTGKRKRHLADFPSACSQFCKRQSSVLSSSRLRSHIVSLDLTAVQSTAKPSRSPNLAASDTNLDGLSIAVVSHATNLFESMHNSKMSLSLRSPTPLHYLSDPSISV